MECEKHKGQGTVWNGDLEMCYGCYCERFDYCPLCGYKWDDPRECRKGEISEDKDTVLEGCEIICIGEQTTDYVACPLTQEEQIKCKERRQYQAGMKEVVKLAIENDVLCPQEEAIKNNCFVCKAFYLKLKEWGIE